jgi:hypothetical protein
MEKQDQVKTKRVQNPIDKKRLSMVEMAKAKKEGEQKGTSTQNQDQVEHHNRKSKTQIGEEIPIKNPKKRSKKAGVTLLFAEKSQDVWIGYLNSYVVTCSTWYQLFEQVLKLMGNELFIKNNSPLNFIGIYDVFYVSSAPKRYAVLGKTYYEEYTDREAANQLISKEEVLLLKGWQICELIYFYEDAQKKDTFVVTCFTLVRTHSIEDLKEKIGIFANNASFKTKILTKRLDKLDSAFLEYVGIKKVNSRGDRLTKYSPFDSYLNEFKSFDEIYSLLPSLKEIEKKEW